MAVLALPAAAGDRRAARWSFAALLVTVLGTAGGVIAVVALPGLQPDLRDGVLQALAVIPPYGLVGAFLLARRPDLPFGWLLAGAATSQVVMLAGVGAASVALRHGYSGALVIGGLSLGSLGFVPIAVQGLVNVRFPSGRPATRAGRRLERGLVAGTALVILGGFLGDGTLRDMNTGRDLHNPLTAGTWVSEAADGLSVLAPLVVLGGLVAGVGVIIRCVRATGVERQQLKWRAAGVVVSLALFPLAVTEHLGGLVTALDGTAFVATLAIPVLRYRLWAIDTILRRSAVYAAVTVVLVAGYALIAGIGAQLVSERVGFGVAAGAVAVGVSPVRRRSQRVVDRLFYGERHDPYQVLSDVGRRLDAVAVPGDVLPAVVTAVTGTLRLPYAAVEGPHGAVIAAAGTAGAVVERWPLTYQGTPMGALVASPRRGEAAFDARDREVLGELARQAGPAVRAEALTADLLESRQRLVTAREEERRRLRRDLHDGIGPMLTGLGLNLDAARTAVARGAEPDAYLAAAKDASAQVIADLRDVVYDLRPPALDDLGLTGAITVHAERLGAELALDAADLPALPAAVEVAALRTAVEAMNKRGPARRRPAVRGPPGRGSRAGGRGDRRRAVGRALAARGRADRDARARRRARRLAGGRANGGRRPSRLPLPAGVAVTTVLLADDHPLVRQGLRAVLDGAEGLAIAGEASDGDEVVRLAAELAPDVVVMDLQMPGLHGIEATRRILAAQPGTAVLVLTMFEDDDTVFAAVAAGACGYLLKGADGADIVTAIRSAAAGQAVFGAALAGRLSRWLAGRPAPAQLPFPQLTERERAILDGVAAGLTNAQIGRELFLSPKTVANNVSTILTKLQVAERGQAIVRAREAGLGRRD